MRVAHVITRLILGGAQENTVLCCEDLLRRGDEVLLITGPPLGPEGSLMKRAEASGVPLEVIGSLRRAIHPLRDAAAYRHIKAALRRFQPEVVHTHSAKAGILGRQAAWALGIPAVVHTVHGAPFHPYQNPAARALFRCCERWAARRCDRLVSVADAMTELMVGAGVAPREKFITVYSGMEVEPFLQSEPLREPTRRRLGYGPEHIVVGKFARLFHLKGHADLVAAARGAVAENPALRFLLVGDGVLRDRLARQIAEAGLSEHFQFTGLMSPEEIPALLAATDFVVHASLREGLARVLPQALISQRPAVSYDVDGAREVVVPGETGLLVPPGDVVGLRGAIVELAAEPEARRRMGREGRRRFAERFRHETMTASLRRLYEELLAVRAAE
jgi:glycosyltransferase involved in cell wall biosynthesis